MTTFKAKSREELIAAFRRAIDRKNGKKKPKRNLKKSAIVVYN